MYSVVNVVQSNAQFRLRCLYRGRGPFVRRHQYYRCVQVANQSPFRRHTRVCHIGYYWYLLGPLLPRPLLLLLLLSAAASNRRAVRYYRTHANLQCRPGRHESNRNIYLHTNTDLKRRWWCRCGYRSRSRIGRCWRNRGTRVVEKCARFWRRHRPLDSKRLADGHVVSAA